MASLPMSMPAEMLHQICASLDQPDLKNCRLVCKMLSYAAEVFLFRQILLERNIESFRRLRRISDHTRIRKHVYGITYRGIVLSDVGCCIDYGKWKNSVYQSASSSNYERYCAIYCENLTQKYDVEIQDLISCFAKLPQLDEVCFIGDRDHTSMQQTSVWSGHPLSSIANETFVGPRPRYGRFLGRLYAQFTIFMKAARAIRKPLISITVLGVPSIIFEPPNESSSLMTLATKSCQYLAIEKSEGGSFKGRENLAHMISSCPSLHTLEINLVDLRSKPHVNLSEIFDAQAHWPHLKRLKLQALEATDVGLKKLLSRHATILRSLDLAHIRLESYPLNGQEHHGSWVEIVLFLQGSLNLESVHLGGNMSNGGDEVWCVHEPIERESFMHRVERFIVEGGPCPLPMPRVAEGSGGGQ